MYLLQDGTEVSKAQIEAAHKAGRARLVHGYKDGGTTTSLTILAEGQADWDMRNSDECQSVWEQTWTRTPATIGEALGAAEIS